MGGKHDDITVTVAQIFKTKNGERKGTAASDPYFEDAKYIYTGDVPKNNSVKESSNLRRRMHVAYNSEF